MCAAHPFLFTPFHLCNHTSKSCTLLSDDRASEGREIEVEVEKDGGKQKRHCERRNGLSEDIYNRLNETTCLSDMQRSSSPSGETVMPACWC